MCNLLHNTHQETLMLVTALSNLHSIITVWTAVNLSWGLYVLALYSTLCKRSMRIHGSVRENDRCNVRFLSGGNILLALFLVTCAIGFPAWGESFLVINTFFTVYLIPSSVNLTKWWVSVICCDRMDDSINGLL